MDSIQEIPCAEIKKQELQRSVSEKGIGELASSIRTMGIIQPLIVAKDGNDYCLIAGQRRLAAAKMARLSTVPCIVIKADHEQALVTSITENIHRESLDPVTEADMYRYLKVTLRKNHRQISKMVSKSEAYISQRINMLDWLPALLHAVKSGAIGFSVGRELARVKEEEHCHYLLQTAIQDGANYRTVRSWVKDWELSKMPRDDREEEQPDDSRATLERKIQMACWWCGESHPTSAMISILVCPICGDQLKDAKAKQIKHG